MNEDMDSAPPDRFSRSERLTLWAAEKPPRWLMEQPERVLLNVACLIIGLTMILPPPMNNVLFGFPPAGRLGLGAVFIAGGLASIIANYRMSRVAERFGSLCLSSASFFMMVLLFAEVGLRAQLTGTIFGMLFLSKLARFLRSAAVRIRIRRHLLDLADSKAAREAS